MELLIMGGFCDDYRFAVPLGDGGITNWNVFDLNIPACNLVTLQIRRRTARS